MTHPDLPPPDRPAPPPSSSDGQWSAPEQGSPYPSPSYDAQHTAWNGANPWGSTGDQRPAGEPAPPARRNAVVIWGLVGSVVLLALIVLFVTTVIDDDPAPLAADSSSTEPRSSSPAKPSPARPSPASPSSAADVVGVPPSDSPPVTVLDACIGMMPVLIYSDAEMAEAATEAESMQIVADMHAAVVWAGGAPDATFQEHLLPLADDLQAIMDATRARENPPGLAADIEDHSFVVGKDCGLHGWTE